MTLVVSLRVPDGVVIAADSLQTSVIAVNMGLPLSLYTKTADGREMPFKLPPFMAPSSSSSFAQKLFSFNGKFGVATYGNAIINNRTIYNHIKGLEKNLKGEDINSTSVLADKIKDYLQHELQLQLNKSSPKQTLQPNQLITGLQVVGYDSDLDEIGHTVEISIGENPQTKSIDGLGCTVSGDNEVVRKLWEIPRNNPMRATNYSSFSLKDAVDYAEFLINTTASYQRFSNMIPTVGGAVDVALVTKYSQFNWIKYKDLTKILEIEPKKKTL